MSQSSISDLATPRSRRPLPTLSPEDRARARIARALRIEGWKGLPVRQAFADEAHMRTFLVRYDVRIASSLEPATATRLRTMLHRAGILAPAYIDAIGCTLKRFLQLNSDLPLWAATALVLESATT